MNDPKQSDITFQEINILVWNHLKARDWHHLSSRSLAISLALEANELLEHYQWHDNPVGNKDEIAAELADVLIYAFEFAQQNDIDMADAIRKKLEAAGKKYPAEHFKGKQDDERRTAWLEAKKRHRQNNS
jgi:NTP pyrophosphatase (non-canonical NTP hydrolase)